MVWQAGYQHFQTGCHMASGGRPCLRCPSCVGPLGRLVSWLRPPSPSALHPTVSTPCRPRAPAPSPPPSLCSLCLLHSGLSSPVPPTHPPTPTSSAGSGLPHPVHLHRAHLPAAQGQRPPDARGDRVGPTHPQGADLLPHHPLPVPHGWELGWAGRRARFGGSSALRPAMQAGSAAAGCWSQLWHCSSLAAPGPSSTGGLCRPLCWLSACR